MEKRLFTSLFLSFAVLYAWTYFVVGPKKTENQTEILQNIDNKEVMVVTNAATTSPVAIVQPPSVEKINVKKQTAESEYLDVEFTNIGGNIANIVIKEFNHSLPVTNLFNIEGYENILFTLEESARNFVSYAYSDKYFKINKRYRLSEDNQSISVEIELTNKSEMSKQINLDIDSFEIDISRLDNSNQGTKMLLEYSVSHNGEIDRKKNISKFGIKENRVVQDSINWIGFRDQYFCAIIKPDFESKEYYFKQINDNSAKLGFKTSELRIDPGTKKVISLLAYYGPQDKKALKIFDARFEKIINYSVGGFYDWMAFKQTDSIAKLMMKLLEFLHRIIPNWGIAIILFAVCIYGITFPLTKKTMSSMKRLQEHQPELTKIRDKYKSNPQKMQKETMEYYKKYKINPLGGCLPMLLQMPIFISLYQLLWRTYEIKGANFLWIKDLSEPDRLFIFPYSFPYFGNEFNILPIVYGILMFFQQKLQAKSSNIMDPVQAQTQKTMAKIFPIMLGILFYKFASGLTLYFTTYFMLTSFSQWKMAQPKKTDNS